MADTVSEHPYMPKDLKLPGYVPCFLSISDILVTYLGSSALLIALVWFASGNRKLTKTDRFLMCWWAFTGLTHFILEGYFALSPELYKEKTPHFLAEVWKEYSKGDSRYVGRDAGVVAVEAVTALIEGPASLLAVYAIATKKPYSYILQFAISIGQLYGCAIYYLTGYLQGDNFAASPFYYWAYYIVANSSWIVVPALVAVRSWKKLTAAVKAQEKTKTK